MDLKILVIIIDYVLVPFVPIIYTPPPTKIVLRKATKKRKERAKYTEQPTTLLMYSADEHLEDVQQRTMFS